MGAAALPACYPAAADQAWQRPVCHLAGLLRMRMVMLHDMACQSKVIVDVILSLDLLLMTPCQAHKLNDRAGKLTHP